MLILGAVVTLYFQYKNELIQTSKYKEVNRTEPSPSVSVPCFDCLVQKALCLNPREMLKDRKKNIFLKLLKVFIFSANIFFNELADYDTSM